MTSFRDQEFHLFNYEFETYKFHISLDGKNRVFRFYYFCPPSEIEFLEKLKHLIIDESIDQLFYQFRSKALALSQGPAVFEKHRIIHLLYEVFKREFKSPSIMESRLDSDRIICRCTGIDEKSLRREKEESLKEFVLKSNATMFCGGCSKLLKSYF